MDQVVLRLSLRKALLGATCAAAVSLAAAVPAQATSAYTGTAAVGTTSATLSGYVATGGLLSLYAFEYGPTLSYGSRSKVGVVSTGAGTVLVTAQIANLKPGTTYHYRLDTLSANVAGQQVITGVGQDATFTTRGDLGRLNLLASSLSASRDAIVLVPLRCASTQPCRGTLKLIVYKRLIGAFVTVTSRPARFTIAAGRDRTVGAWIGQGGVRLLQSVSGHRTNGLVSITLTSGQSPLSRAVTVALR